VLFIFSDTFQTMPVPALFIIDTNNFLPGLLT